MTATKTCPVDHRHSESGNCYNRHGCRCEPCRSTRQAYRSRGDWEMNHLRGRDVQVAALGTQRRLQGLAYMGWSMAEIASRIDSHARPLMNIRAGARKRVRLSTHRRVAGVFRELAATEAPGHSGDITRGFARVAGFVPPFAWDDIDDAAEQPKGLAHAEP